MATAARLATVFLTSALRSIVRDRKSTRLNSSHTEIYTLSLHDALPIFVERVPVAQVAAQAVDGDGGSIGDSLFDIGTAFDCARSEEHTSELQSHRDLHSFPTRRSSDLCRTCTSCAGCRAGC